MIATVAIPFDSQTALCRAHRGSAWWVPWWSSAGVGVLAFLVTTLLVGQVSASPLIACALVCGLLLLTARLRPAPVTRVDPAGPPGWDLGMQMLIATTMVVGLTSIAATVGPRWTGLWSPCPVFALVLGAFTHRTPGAGAAAHL